MSGDTKFFGSKLKLIVLIGGAVILLAIFGYGIREWLFFERSYYPNGQLACRGRIAIFGTRDNRHSGIVECFYPNGKKKFLGENRHGVWQGRRRVWNENGLLIEDWEYERSVPVDGNRKIYWHNGLLMFDETRHGGIIVGTSHYFNEDGILMARCEYKDGAPYSGQHVTLVFHGADIPVLHEVVPYRNGERHGSAKYTLGRVQIEVHWKDDSVELRKSAYDNQANWTGFASGKPVFWATFRPEGLKDFRFWLDQTGRQSSDVKELPGSFAGRLFRLLKNPSRVELVE